jgi:hypothetical protein
MERASQFLSDLCTKTLSTTKTEKINEPNIERLSYKNSFKYSLLHQAEIRIEIRSPTSFSIFEGESDLPDANGKNISEARLTDFFLGANRVKTHYQDLIKAKNAHMSSAWLLVTAYYCCFFSCIELLKINNHIQIGFDAEDLSLLQTRATGVDKAAFFAKPPLNFIGQFHANKIVFESNGDKPHQAAWQHLNKILNSAFKGKSWVEVEMLKKILSEQHLNPSRVRNNWNYKRPDYFGIKGELFGIQFKKLLGNPKGASEWLVKNGSTAEPDDSSRIAAMCEILAPAVIDAYDRIRRVKNQQS